MSVNYEKFILIFDYENELLLVFYKLSFVIARLFCFLMCFGFGDRFLQVYTVHLVCQRMEAIAL